MSKRIDISGLNPKEYIIIKGARVHNLKNLHVAIARLKLLFATVGKTYSPVSGKLVKRHNVSDVVDFVVKLPAETKCLILSKIIIPKGRTLKQTIDLLSQQGFARVVIQNTIHKIAELD